MFTLSLQIGVDGWEWDACGAGGGGRLERHSPLYPTVRELPVCTVPGPGLGADLPAPLLGQPRRPPPPLPHLLLHLRLTQGRAGEHSSSSVRVKDLHPNFSTVRIDLWFNVVIKAL